MLFIRGPLLYPFEDIRFFFIRNVQVGFGRRHHEVGIIGDQTMEDLAFTQVTRDNSTIA